MKRPRVKDKKTMNALAMVQRLEQREAMRTGLSQREARKVVARKAQVLPGTLERIRRDRVKDQRVGVFNRIRDLFIREAEKEIEALQHEILIARQTGLDPTGEQAAEIEATLAKLKELMGK